MNELDPPNPFESANRIIGVTVLLKPSDITEGWHGLTIAQAERLLDVYGSAIAAQMLASGITAVVQIAKQEGAPS